MVSMNTRDARSHLSLLGQRWQEPWAWLLGAATGSLLALAWLLLFGEAAAGARAFWLFLSLLAAGVAIVLRPSAPEVVGSAAGVGLLGWLALGPWEDSGVPWDSARHMMVFLTGVAAVAALVLWLPRG